MARFGMVVDLRKCVGCGTCETVCDQIRNVPPGSRWRRVVECKADEDLVNQPLFLSICCMHCDKPPCLDACPTGATHRRPDGIVEIKYELCVGCGCCVVACPYQARTICVEDKIQFEANADTQDTILSISDRIGVCTKCDFCFKDLDGGLAHRKSSGTDDEASPACVRFCIAEALCFGDLDDPESEIFRLIKENKAVRFNEELGTDCSVYYIYDSDSLKEC